MQVDPENRHVAETLEKEWNDRLHILRIAEEEYQRKTQVEMKKIDNNIFFAKLML